MPTAHTPESTTEPPASPAVGTQGDAAIIAASIADPAGFAAIFDRHQAMVVRYAVTRVGPDAAHDVVAETFLAAFRSRAKFNPELSIDAKPWLLGIATTLIRRHRSAEASWIARCAEHVRVERGDRVRRADALDVIDGRTEDGVVGQLDARQAVPALMHALEALSPRERDPLLLHAIAGLSYDDVAATLEIPVGTVRSRISRAKARLSSVLESPGGGDA